ncbi:Na+/H+ antiporter [Planomicrobium sp. CPCC 101110]|uniref:Na+/H+ antiporter n=1 Tax=Planomicrobium sp. CPCC 101110 TaxID=2599619 RepID=UPI0011B64031|nr:Na+/H+ antiporter [Planomicrobium sp. CPCC 101110]TWT25879.1 Na+/H+ antiporter [Planomicrobium sp. CPCC 101110]
MDLLLTVLVLLFCLLISNIVSHYTPYIPTALIQVALGILLVVAVKDFTFEIETEWFLLLFIAPLLYNDGRHFPREELWRMRGPILGNAIILVLLTTVVGGYFIHWLIPSIPLTASFALAAILSPTDPVAVNGIAKRIHIPEKVLNLVRGESLINDASGLVAFNYAVAAVVTGYFSLREAVLDFSYKFVAGAFLGLFLALLIIGIRYLLRKQGISDVTFFTLLHVVTPFLIFIVTEEFLHASGVIAVVVAGIVHSLVRERTETFIAEEQILTEDIWKIILFILNGIVFLLLGLNIPPSMSGVLENADSGLWRLLLYVILIGSVILGIRFVWAYLFAAYEYRFSKTENFAEPNLKTTLFVSLTGVRGTVTMVGVLSIPFVLESGEDFPNRSLILFLAAGTILFTLIAATLLLPLLSRGMLDEGESEPEMNLEEARRRVLLASINKIKDEMTEENEPVAYELMDEYKLRLNQLEPNEKLMEQKSKKYQRKLKETRLLALKEERNYIEDIEQKQGMDQEMYEAFEKSLDRREQAIEKNVRAFTIYLQGKLTRAWKRFRGHYVKDEETRLIKLQIGKDIQLAALQAALHRLEEGHKENEKDETIDTVIMEYNRMISGLKKPESLFNENYDIQKEELRIIVMDMGRSEIFRMYDEGQITREQAKELRRYVNYLESVTLHELIE